MAARRPDDRESGQASLEVVGLLPLAVLVVTAAAHLLAAGVARELAGHAAEAGAVAIVQEEDPSAAARRAVPDWSRRRMDVRVADRRVSVELRPPALWRSVSDALAASASADAGPPVGEDPG